MCSEISSRVTAVGEAAPEVACEACGAAANRIISRPSVHLSKASKLDRLDPKYDKMVDKAMSSTQNAEPDRILKKMKPFPKDD
jgi:predicted nucleic acid-binding Zn ribbon protein